MKTEIHEYDGKMQLELTPETMAEQAQLVRLGMNAKDKDATIATSIWKDETMDTFITVDKYHHASDDVKKNR